MSVGSDYPDDVMDAVRVIHDLRGKTYLSRQDRENLNRAKLRIAYWVCRSENIIASRENLTYVLGADAGDIMRAYEKYLESPKKDADKKGTKKRGGTQFWGGAS
ncbi:MAG: hypothetical protein LUE17_03285 [Planctomycetaceae bacterium]|nr:hypothetical protein [Planctomycetaceae bacterium]